MKRRRTPMEEWEDDPLAVQSLLEMVMEMGNLNYDRASRIVRNIIRTTRPRWPVKR